MPSHFSGLLAGRLRGWVTRRRAAGAAAIASMLIIGPFLPLLVALALGIWLLTQVAQAGFGSRLPLAARRPWRWVTAQVVLLYVIILLSGAAAPGSLLGGLVTALRLLLPLLMLAAVLSFPGRRASWSERVGLALDMLMFGGCGFLLVWYLLLGPALTLGVSLAGALPALASPVLDLAMATGSVLVLMRGVAAALRWPVRLLIASSALLIVPDLTIAFDIAHGRAARVGMQLPPLASGASVAGLLLLLVAVWIGRRGVADGLDSWAVAPSRNLRYVPYVAVVLGFALLLAVALRAGLFPWVGLVAGAMAMVTGLIIRQLLSLLEHERLAITDPLTGLTNRRGLMKELSRSVERDTVRGGVAVLLFDLNSFKQINDEFGHAAGDAALVAFGRVLRRSVLGRETVGRLGGDEFAVVLNGVTTAGQAVIVAERIIAELELPADLGRVQLRLSTSIGIALADGTQTPDELLGHADHAMYRSKAARRSTWTVFTPGSAEDATVPEQVDSAVGKD